MVNLKKRDIKKSNGSTLDLTSGGWEFSMLTATWFFRLRSFHFSCVFYCFLSFLIPLLILFFLFLHWVFFKAMWSQQLLGDIQKEVALHGEINFCIKFRSRIDFSWATVYHHYHEHDLNRCLLFRMARWGWEEMQWSLPARNHWIWTRQSHL